MEPDIGILESDQEAIESPHMPSGERERKYNQMNFRVIGRKVKLFPEHINDLKLISNKSIMLALQNISEE